MNVKRFTGRNSREAMQKVKAAFGGDAVVLSTKPAAEGGIEILAMAADSVPAMDHYAVEKDAPELAPRESRSEARSESRLDARADSRTEPRDEAVSAQPRKAVGKQAKETMANLASTVQDDVKQ